MVLICLDGVGGQAGGRVSRLTPPALRILRMSVQVQVTSCHPPSSGQTATLDESLRADAEGGEQGWMVRSGPPPSSKP